MKLPIIAAAAALAAASGFAACTEHRTVTLLFGPTDTTLTVGFTCKDDSGALLLARTLGPSGYTFQLVLETVDLGKTLPGCRGEELLASCGKHGCKRIGRFCATVTVPTMDSVAILAALHAQLGHPTLIADAPSDPVIVRAVATQQSCDALMPADGTYPKLDPDLAVGCAYSCPVVLDDLRGTLGMALDTLDDQCEAEVQSCAGLGS
ncbi:MAG TPA: hypothetical protein VH165_09110 [Kofleriaceae bacterium]|jgi:hypothetical protein|nr:hypothetical protein [Kofleriaceae bacterium]